VARFSDDNDRCLTSQVGLVRGHHGTIALPTLIMGPVETQALDALFVPLDHSHTTYSRDTPALTRS
jgi:hypothetical protein